MPLSGDQGGGSRGNGHTQKEHLDLVPLQHLVTLELVLNLLVAGLALLVLSTHTATHFDGCRSGF